MIFKRNRSINTDFTKISISIASPESILENSFGEVKEAETINYRTYKPETDGLFCERIFGPIKDWECHCGKYKRIRYKGVTCDRCGVEVTEKKVRRERMGHIELVVPVAHIWYFKCLPNKIGYILGIPSKKLDQIIYYEKYVVIQPGICAQNGMNELDFLSENEYINILENILSDNQALEDSNPNKFIAKTGAEAIEILLKKIDLDSISYALRQSITTESSQQKKIDALKRLRVIEAFRSSREKKQNNPEWMILKVVPVIPPELRPLVALDGGRFATSDLNDFYRRVIIRNNRLKKLIDIKAPEVVLRNEKRMLQEAVDALLDNSRKIGTSGRSEGGGTTKSLSDMLKGKQGRFRKNLLGKRVDYSGRSVIVVGPELKMHECGLPKEMAAELFKPFIIRRLIERGITTTVKDAKKIIDSKDPCIWDILENILKGHPILLNRAPTLHRMGIQAFHPKLIEHKAIQLHPLVCTAFNADFDGDQMAVHVPLGQEAILEASLLMIASNNILNPANGAPICVPSQDMVLGLYYMTKGRKSTPNEKIMGEGITFYSSEEVVIAFNEKKLSKHAHIKVRVKVRNENGELKTKIIETVAGRVLFNLCIPEEVGFLDELLTKKKLQQIIGLVFKICGMSRTSQFLDDIKDLGFKYAYQGGLSIGLNDINIPDEKNLFIEDAQKQIESVLNSYYGGLIGENEKYNKVINIWTVVNKRLTEKLLKNLEQDNQGFNSIYMMMHSGARGSKEQVRQLAGMRGLMAKPQKNIQGAIGEIIENPIISNFKEGLEVWEYFISTHGARKGLADTALKTADAGYLTRRLIDVTQDVIINEVDCDTLRGITITAVIDKTNDEVIESLSDRILGRVSLHDIYDITSDKLIVSTGQEIREDIAAEIEKSGIEEVETRSVLTCESEKGVCSKCFGRNFSSGRMVEIGEPVGVIAAQSIGEPGTQLTLRTFHVGGAASNIAVENTIKARFPGIVEFEELKSVVLETGNQKNTIVLGRSGEIRIKDEKTGKILISQNVPYGTILRVNENEKVEKGQELCYWDPYNAVILSEYNGKVKLIHIEEGITFKEDYDEQTGRTEKIITESKDKSKTPTIYILKEDQIIREYSLPVGAHLSVEDDQMIQKGEIIAKIPRVTSKYRDITGGLPRVTELFEARNTSNVAVVSEIDGVISYGQLRKGNREIIVESKDGYKKKYMVPLTKHIIVQDNDFVKAGGSLTDGVISLADILAIKGPTAVQEYLVNEIQEVYRLQGVKINDKHIEVIVRQMMQKVVIVDSCDTTLLPNQVIDKILFRKENESIMDKKIVVDAGDSPNIKAGQMISLKMLRNENTALKTKGQKLLIVRNVNAAVSRPILQGITQASLDTESFLSAASFQETTKVLSEAAIKGKIDTLNGLKENVLVGHLIPAGTGVKKFNEYAVGSNNTYLYLYNKEYNTKSHNL